MGSPRKPQESGGGTPRLPPSHLSHRLEEFGKKESPNALKKIVKRVKYPRHQTCLVKGPN
jgi:hypothetical protein